MSGTVGEREYVLGTDEAEVARLGLQHRLWSDVAGAHWLRGGFGPGQSILDVGCGPGFASRDLAQLVGPGGRVLGVDESARYVAFVNSTPAPPGAGSIEAVEGDAQVLDVGEGVFDGAYARWVLSFTPEPARVVAGVSRALRVGGAFCVQDYSNWMGLHWGPRSETVEVLRRGILSAYAAVAADSCVGSSVAGMMDAAGLEVVEIRPLSRVARPGEAMWQWPRTYFRTFLPRVVAGGHMSESERLAIESEWDANEGEAGAMFMTPPQVEVIGIKRDG